MFGSVVPSASTRRRMTSIVWSTARRTRSRTPVSVSVSCRSPSAPSRTSNVGGRGNAERVDAAGLGLLAKTRDRLLPVGRLGNAHLDGAARAADAAGDADSLLAQDAPDVVAQVLDLRADDVRLIDFQKDMRAALKVEAQSDRLERHPVRQFPCDRVRAFPSRGRSARSQEMRRGSSPAPLRSSTSRSETWDSVRMGARAARARALKKAIP